MELNRLYWNPEDEKKETFPPPQENRSVKELNSIAHNGCERDETIITHSIFHARLLHLPFTKMQ